MKFWGRELTANRTVITVSTGYLFLWLWWLWSQSGLGQETGLPSTIRATVVRRNAVLAGDLKGLVYYVISKLNKDTPSSGSKEERIRIHLWAWANIQNHSLQI